MVNQMAFLFCKRAYEMLLLKLSCDGSNLSTLKILNLETLYAV